MPDHDGEYVQRQCAACPWRDMAMMRKEFPEIVVKGCERAMNPSVYADPPCTCHCPSVPGDAPTPAALAILGFARSDHRWSTEADHFGSSAPPPKGP